MHASDEQGWACTGGSRQGGLLGAGEVPYIPLCGMQVVPTVYHPGTLLRTSRRDSSPRLRTSRRDSSPLLRTVFSGLYASQNSLLAVFMPLRTVFYEGNLLPGQSFMRVTSFPDSL